MFRKIVIVLLTVLSLVSVRSFVAAQSSDANTLKANKALIQTVVKDVFNGHNLDLIDKYYSADFVEHNPIAPPNLPAGPAGFKMLAGGIIAAFPDVTVTVEDILAEGDKAVSRHSVKATNKAAFNGIPATNKPVTWSEIHIWRIKDGQIAEHWAELNALGLIQQLTTPATKTP